MSDDQIGVTVIVDVGAGESARMIKVDRAKRGRSGDVGEAAISEISQQHYFARTCRVAFANGGEVNPAVIVDVDRGDPPTANPLWFGNINSLKPRPVDVLP